MYKAPKEYNLKSEIAFSFPSVCFFDYLKTIYIDVYRTVFKIYYNLYKFSFCNAVPKFSLNFSVFPQGLMNMALDIQLGRMILNCCNITTYMQTTY